MPLAMETTAEADLLLIDGLEIEPLPDVLASGDAVGTSESPACCSCHACSNPPGEDPCWIFTLFGS